MKKHTLFVAALGLLIGMAVTPAYAQPGGVKAKIPFDFTVGAKTFPAGEYTMIAVPHRVDIQDAKGKKIAVFLANEISGHSSGVEAQIVFHCYSEQCFLSEVWSPDYENGRLLSSRSEGELAKKETGKYVALLEPKTQK